MADTVLTELKIHDFDTLEQMSQYESEIGDNDIVFTPDMSAKLFLFKHAWSDYLVSDMSWLRADTFSWHSGETYETAYEHLRNDFSNSQSFAHIKTDTIGDIEITYYQADDGHKICTQDQESNLVALYEATGVAWYYLLDTENKQFKLPRTKYGFTGLRDSVGGYVEPGAPNITAQVGEVDFSGSRSFSGALYEISSPDGNTGATHSGGTRTTFGFDASLSNPIYGNSTTVQPPATEQYLYFYVGNFTQTAIENTAGLNTEMFNDLNAHKVIEFQKPTAENGYTWYRKYADGWVEQGGVGIAADASSAFRATFPVVMADTNFTLLAISKTPSSTSASTPHGCHYSSKTTTGCNIISLAGNSGSWVTAEVCWQASGIAA